MTIKVEIKGTGQIAEFPDGTPPEVIQRALAQQAESGQEAQAEPFNISQAGVVDRIKGGFSPMDVIRQSGAPEVAATMGSSVIAEPIAGLTGLLSMLPADPRGMSAEQVLASQQGEQTPAGDVVAQVRDALTVMPKTAAGNQALLAIAEKLKPLTDMIQSIEKASGETGFDFAGPIGGAIGEALPTAISEMLGLGAVRRAKRVSQLVPDAKAAEIIETGKAFDVPVLTTDVRPPETFSGKFLQQLSEKLGPLGSGSARQTQQTARQSIVQGMADEFEIELDSDFSSLMVNSINKKSSKALREAGAQRNRAVTALNKHGNVPVNRTLETIASEINKQERLGAKGNTAVVENLSNIRDSIQDGNFDLVKDIRSEVISDLKALGRSEDTRATAATQRIKSAIDKDLMDFARANDRTAAADWIRSNRAFADEYSIIKDSEIKRVLNKGDATPEVVMPILKAGKLSELRRLKNSLGVNGRSAARSAIIQDALKESGFFGGNINPDRLATALLKPNRQLAVDVFFEGVDKKQLNGLTRLLDATRRAQQASAAPATGVQTVPLLATGGVGAGMSVAPFTTMSTIGTLAAFAKAYESGPMRSLLLRIDNSKQGSKIETGILEAAVPLFLEGLQAAKTEPEETE